MDIDTYYDNHPLNPANQPEPKSVISYEVVVFNDPDYPSASFEFDTLEAAETKFNKIAYGTEFDWVEMLLIEFIDGKLSKYIESALSSTLFLEMKRTLARIREIESFPMDATSDEQQELVELKRKLYGQS